MKPLQDHTNTPDELLDLVNEKDEVIGEVFKREANNNINLIHREIAVILRNSKNQILIQQRSFKKKVYPGYWTVSVAGHIPKGMKPTDAAHMELREELGFDTNLTFLTKELLHLPNETIFEHWYIGDYNNEEIKIEKEEVEQVRFVNQHELREMLTAGEQVEENCVRVMNMFWNGEFYHEA